MRRGHQVEGRPLVSSSARRYRGPVPLSPGAHLAGTPARWGPRRRPVPSVAHSSAGAPSACRVGGGYHRGAIGSAHRLGLSADVCTGLGVFGPWAFGHARQRFRPDRARSKGWPIGRYVRVARIAGGVDSRPIEKMQVSVWIGGRSRRWPRRSGGRGRGRTAPGPARQVARRAPSRSAGLVGRPREPGDVGGCRFGGAAFGGLAPVQVERSHQ